MNMTASKLFLNQTSYFTMERDFKEKDVTPWLRRMASFTWACAAFYLGTIFGLQRFMKNKAPLHLRPALVAWSAFLALFSITGTIRLIPERFHTVQTHGWTYSVCTMEYHSGPVGFWTFLCFVQNI